MNPRASSITFFGRYGLLAVILAICGSAVLGIIRLRELSFWFDEVTSLESAHDYAATALRFPEQMPAYFAVLGGWLRLVGESEVAGRWLSLLCGLLALAFTYRIARSWASPPIALFSLIVLGSSAFFVRYFREMRPYAFLACLAAASMHFYLRWLTQRRRTDALFYALSTAVILYTHYFAGLLVAVQLLFTLLYLHPLRLKPRVRLELTPQVAQAFGLHLAPVLILLPYLPIYAAVLGKVAAGGRYLVALTPAQAISTVTQALTNDNLGLFLLLAILALSVRRRALTLALIWLWLPLGAVLIVHSFIFQVLTNPRYLIFVWPAAALLIGLGIGALPPRLRGLALGLCLLIGIGQVINDLPAKFPGVLNDQPWRQLFQTISQFADQHDVVLVNFVDPVGLTGYREPIDWYAHRYRPDSPNPIYLDNPDPVPPPLSEILTPVSGAWLLTTDGPSNVRGRAAIDHLSSMGFAACDIHTYDHQATLRQWERVTAPYVTFGGLLNLHSTPLNPAPANLHPGDDLALDLGWRVLQKPPINYSMGVYILDQTGRLVAQQDGTPGGLQTSAWQIGQIFCDVHHFKAPAPGTYTVQVAVYDSAGGRRLSIAPSAADIIPIFAFSVR